jgi:KDO2-lipid IV(A) lauroyltransferase
MGRTAAEYFFIDRIWDFDAAATKPGRIEIEGEERFVKLATDGKPAIVLSAHLANWELPMVAAARHGLNAVTLFNSPRNRWIARMVTARRKSSMGELVTAGSGALHHLASALKAGSHLGLLVDQFYERGPKIVMFGHQTTANPVFARLARQIECPVHMVRVVRLPHDRFRIELGEELDLPRGADGRIDVAAASQMVGTIIEGWVREHPDQWLWVHRRWR